ncbi:MULTISPECIES: alpha/beta hydrolase [Kitasatospora]|uniref:Putative peptidase S33 family protein n=1 Tax=Kitasatospora setae (strain ATCC 33774 / DSM 43861 / JCM 3304 / KCC A-0304 / NBRC 14216 / KM-6054) TaxID=452652 RepID=E4NJR9_KITSK|nr:MULTISPECIES: alpha/beta hydrolase [Kitasatospora]BAJ33217.1 putative peptidase S33 family protein [Kitasatospora setae KM-6054]
MDRRTFHLAGVAAGTGLLATTAGGRAYGAQYGAPYGTVLSDVLAVPWALKRVAAGELNVGYAECGPAGGPVVVCLHGWPYDIHSYAEVAPLLAARGYRVVVPYLRGHGLTRFRSEHTPRNAQQAAVARDLIALLDTLGISRALLAGFDWGARTAAIAAALWPERVRALVSVGGYLITDVRAQADPLAAEAEHAWWYQYYFTTERGRRALVDRRLRRDLCRLVWQNASPTWKFEEEVFDRTAAAFDNPDYPDIVVHNYRWRLGLAPGEHRYDADERRLATRPVITVPTVTLDAALDPFTAPGGGRAHRDRFAGPYLHRTVDGVGHNLPQEAPGEFVRAVLDADRL